MSDTSPEYIKMCATCGLEWTPEVGMRVFEKKSQSVFLIYSTHAHKQHFWCGENNRLGTIQQKYKSQVFPLWSQEQLWEKVGLTVETVNTFYMDYIRSAQLDLERGRTSWQRLLLAFVMQELHKKRWTVEGWEGIG